MEEPLFQYKNRLLNTLIIIYWIILYLSALYVAKHLNLITNLISLVLFSLIVMVFIWPVKRLKLDIYIDAIVFKEKGWHPQLENEFGVAFGNIYDYKIKKVALTLKWMIIKRKNGKTIRRLIS